MATLREQIEEKLPALKLEFRLRGMSTGYVDYLLANPGFAAYPHIAVAIKTVIPGFTYSRWSQEEKEAGRGMGGPYAAWIWGSNYTVEVK